MLLLEAFLIFIIAVIISSIIHNKFPKVPMAFVQIALGVCLYVLPIPLHYGLAIITIVLIIRVLLLPFMVLQVKNMHMMREKTKVVQPQIDTLKENVKLAKTQEEKLKANKLLMDTYKQYDINPLKNMIGCLPILIQLPILYGLIITLKFPSDGGIDSHPLFFGLI